MSKIVHYRDKCIGCGICYDMHPAHWRMSTKDGKATLVNATLKNKVYLLDIYERDRALVESIAVACPVKIIKVV